MKYYVVRWCLDNQIILGNGSLSLLVVIPIFRMSHQRPDHIEQCRQDQPHCMVASSVLLTHIICFQNCSFELA